MRESREIMSDSIYKVQTRKQGGAYATHLTTSNAAQAEIIYRGYNIGDGYAKRLVQDGKTVRRYSCIFA